MSVNFDVCICTYSPEKETFARVLESIANQTLPSSQFRLLVVDNASEPEIRWGDFPFEKMTSSGIEVVLIREPTLGVAHARIRAIRESTANAIVFVDDDNLLKSDFLEVAQKIIERNPEVGCFSGKIKIPNELSVPIWIRPLLGSFAVRDVGEIPIIDWFTGKWKLWIPVATASMVLKREVADAFLTQHGARRDYFSFGRKGRNGLLSGEDFLIALSAVDAGLKCGYFPELVMWHLIRPDRFRFSYVAKLWCGYGLTDVKRDIYLGQKPEPISLRHRLLALDLKGENIRARFCYWLYQLIYVGGCAFRSLFLSEK